MHGAFKHLEGGMDLLLRRHAGVPGNERADRLASMAPMTEISKMSRAEILQKDNNLVSRTLLTLHNLETWRYV